MSNAVVVELFAIARRLCLSTTDLGVLCSCAPQTIRFVELSGRLPVRRPQRESIERFVARAREAERRSDLHLEDLEVRP